MKIKIQFLTLSIFLATSLVSFSQTFGCSGTITDPGGAGDYGSNENYTETFCSDGADPIWLQFTEFETEGTFDQMEIYDGPNTGSPLIGTYDGTGSPGTVGGSSCITIVFTSDGSVEYSGWSAEIICSATEPPPIPVPNPCMVVTPTSIPAGCVDALPFCTGSTYTFPNTTGTASGGTLGCLSSTPNPIWYFLEVEDEGPIDIFIEQLGADGVTQLDVDFALMGPYTTVADACANPDDACIIDCSYSFTNTETANVAWGQPGEVYMLLLTNYSDDPGTIEFSQTSGVGSTDCSIVDPCNIASFTANVGTCTTAGGTYQTTGTVTFTDPPATGQLIVEDCDGNQDVLNMPNAGPFNYTITGQDPDGAACDIHVYFSDATSCEAQIDYTAPTCPSCFMTGLIDVVIGAPAACELTYETTGTVTFTDPPTTGQLIVEDCNGNNHTVNAPFTSPFDFTIPNQSADGAACDITARFTDEVCSIGPLAYVAPQGTGLDETGTVTAAHAGDGINTPVGGNTYILCDQDFFGISDDGNFTLQNITASTPDPTDVFDPGVGYLVYSCPPTLFGPGVDLNTDPCLIGFLDDDFTVQNNGGSADGNMIFFEGQPNGPLTDQTFYVVPIGLYDNTNNYYNSSCYDLATEQTMIVQYLNPITFTVVEDCNAGTAVLTISGGYPEFYGGNYTFSNLSDGTFTDNTASHGETITISGLTGGEDYSFDVVDANGCPITMNPAGTFPPVFDAAFAYPAPGEYCTTDADPSPIGVTNPGGTYHSIQAGLSINAGNGAIDLSASADGTYDVVYSTQPLDAVCFDTDTFQVVVNATPVVDDVTNVIACDTYTIPNIGAINNANNTGTLGFYNGPGGTLGQVAFGSAWTTDGTTTLYIYDETGTTPNCFDEEDYTITINLTPVVDDITDATVCDSYTMPVLGDVDNSNNTANLGIYNGPGGTLGQVAFGSNFTTAGATTFYIYDETATAPNCFDEEDFTITINESVDAGADDGATLCNAAGNQLTLSTLLAGADAGGVWSETTGLPHGGAGVASGAFNAATTVFDPDGLTPQVYTFMYLLTTTAPCVNDTAFFTINVTGLIDAGNDNSITFCNTPGATTDVNDLLDAGVTGGTWSQFSGPAAGAAFTAGTGVLDMSNLAAGDYVFRYTIPASGPCLGDDADMTVTINEIPYIDNPSDAVVCDTYTLPAITGTSLSAGVGYYTAPDGGGANLAEGAAVTTAGLNTIYVYDATGTTPNCFDEDTFTVMVNITPVVDDITDDIFCDTYSLPAAVPGTNLTGNAGFFTAPDGGGTELLAGSAITTAGVNTIYIYDETATSPNCSTEEDFTITINLTPVVDDIVDATVCDSYTMPVLADVDNSNNTAGLGIFNGPGGTLGQVAFGSNFTTAGATTFYIYDETGTAPNCFDEEDFTITINQSVEAGADDGVTLCNAAGNTLTLSTLLDGIADAGGVWSETTGLPHGGAGAASGSFNAVSTVFEPFALTPQVYTFMYLLTTTAPCVNDTAFFTINVTGLIDAGNDNSITFCNTPGATTDVNDLLDAGVTGGTWSQFSGPATGQFNTGTGVFDLTDLAAGDYVFRYTIPASGPCVGDDADMTVTINEIPYIDNPSDVVECDTYTLPVITGTSLTAGVGYFTASNGGGVQLAENSAYTTPGGNLVYVYNETGTFPNCFDEDTFDINITITPVIDDIADVILCDSYSLPAAVTGTDIPFDAGFYTETNGGGLEWALGSAITSTQTVYIYAEADANSSCTHEQDFSVTINLTPVVDDITDETVCDSYTMPILADVDNSNNTAGLGIYNGPGGTLGQVAFGSNFTTAGSTTFYIYDETGTAPNCFDEEDFTITINESVNAGLDNGQQVCNIGGTSINLGADLLDVTADAGGVWSETTGLPHGVVGTSSGAAFDPGTTILNAGGLAEGTYSFMYLLTTTAPCLNDTAFFTINVTGLIDAGNDNSIILCNTQNADIDLNTMLDAGVTGGAWTETTVGPSGQFTVASGVLDLTDLTAGDYTFDYSIPANGSCPGDDADITVTINEIPYIDNPSDAVVCDTYTLPAITGTSLSAGVGYYTAPDGGGANLAEGAAVTTAGLNTIYVYDATGTTPNCFDEDTFTVMVNITPVVDDITDDIFCDTYSLPAAVPGTNLTGNAGFFTAPDGGGTELLAGSAITTAGVNTIYIYDETATSPNCSTEEDFTITINLTPVVDDITDETVCDSYTMPVLADVDNSNNTAGLGIFNGPGGTLGQVAFGSNFTTAGATTFYIYDETGTAPNCFDEEDFTITINQSVEAGADNDLTLCNAAGNQLTLSTLLDGIADAGGVWSETTGLPHGGAGTASGTFDVGTTVFNPTGLTPQVYTFMYLLTATAPCVNDTAFFTINVTGLIDAGNDNSITFCNTPGATSDVNDLLDAGVTGGTWSQFSGPATAQFTNATGVFDLSNLAAGDYVFRYTIPASGPCVGDDADMTVTINEIPYIDNPSDVTVCDTYTLPAITGTSLTAGVGYYTATNGGGVNLAVGSNITTAGPNTIYVYDETGTAPNCFEQDTFVVTVNITPVVDDIVNVIACDTYSLPAAVAGTNITGNAGYYTATSGGGLQLVNGSAITTAGVNTVYIYDETATTPNCTHEQDFTVTINVTPTVDDILDQEECDTYSLPAGGVTGSDITANAGFFTAPGGGGVQLADGSAITTPGTTTVYIYDETATAPNCTDEQEFDVVINVTPSLDAVADQAECDSYTLPAISGTDMTGAGYFTATNGGGASLAVGANITAEGTTTVYVYDETGTTPNCTDEVSFDVLINITPDVADLLDGAYCDDYELPQITAAAGGVLTGNEAYYTGTNGTGTQYNAGDLINTSTTLFIYDATTGPVCSDEEQVDITINNAITAGADNAESICAEGGVVNVGVLLDPLADVNPDADAWSETTITGASGGFDPATQMFDVTGLTAGDYTFEYHVDGVAPCLLASAEFTVVVHPLPIVEAGADFTECQGVSILLGGSVAANSPVGSAGMDSYTWDQGVVDGVLYLPGGTNTYNVVGVDTNGCQATDNITVDIEASPIVSYDPILSGCSPLSTTFNYTVSNGVVINSSVWTISNGDVFNGNNISTTFTDEGPYDFTLDLVSANGCNYTFTEQDYFSVNERPIASFTHGPGEYTVTNPIVEFTNQSDNANAYEWTFGDGNTSAEEHPTHTYSTDPNTYEVQLVAFGAPGDPNCVDTAVLNIPILDELLYHIPNTFTPDQDDFNETFQPVFISGFDPYDFTLLIFDRWGEILFESHDASIGWDGKYGGKLVQDGTYIWKIDFKETMSDKRHSKLGHVNVLK